MRRTDREVTNPEEICSILKKAEVLRIAMNDGDYPCILPVNFGFEMKGGKLCLHFHGSDQGSRHEIIRRDSRVSFEVDCGHMLIAEHYGIPAETFHPGYFASTAVYKITVEHYTAKRRQVKP